MSTYKVVTNGNDYKVNVDSVDHKVEVKKVEYKVSLSRTGGQGASNNDIGGLPISVSGVEEGDLLTVSSNQWVNTRRTNITDGGNF